MSPTATALSGVHTGGGEGIERDLLTLEDVTVSLVTERLAFQRVARMPQVGRKFDRWLDLVLLERVID